MRSATSTLTASLSEHFGAERRVCVSRVTDGEVHLCRDAQFLNAVVNDPSVRPFVGGEGEIDLAEHVVRSEHWPLLNRHGGFLLTWAAPGVHEVHTFILPSGRGAIGMAMARSGIAFARNRGDTMLWTRIKPAHRHVAAFAQRMGMRRSGEMIETFGELYAVYKMDIGLCQ